MIENQLLNAILQTRDYGALVRNGLADVMCWRELPSAFQFITSHREQYGELPSVESIVAHMVIINKQLVTERKQPEVFEVVEVVESVDTLCAKLIERNLKLGIKQLLTDAASKYTVDDGYKLMDRLQTGLDKLQETSNRRGRNGVNWAINGEQRYAAYETRKTRAHVKNLPLLFDEFTEATGGCERGDVITFMAFTGKGKSWNGFLQALKCNDAGHNVLVEAAEMSKDAVQSRLDTLAGGFSNRGLWTGELDMRVEQQYQAFTSQFNRESGRANLVIKTPEDWANGLTLQQLENDIDQSKCDLVIIDQFNLMRFGGTSASDKSAFSRRLKELAAKKGVVIFLLYQTNGDYEKGASRDDAGIRELRLPDLSNYSETIAVIQDSAIVIGFDAVTWLDVAAGNKRRGKALCGILKGRNGGDGLTVELDWMPNDGNIQPRKPTDIF